VLALKGYRLERELGRGGMGAVYLIVRERTGLQVALKVMLPQATAQQHNRDLFQREVANMKGLAHRHVVRLLEFGYSEGTYFFTQEYCERGSIGDLLKQFGKLPVGKAVALTQQALRGLEYAHQVDVLSAPLAGGGSARARGLVHRDIKPQNIFLAKSGEKYIAKIGDYGLAKAFDLAGLSGLSMTGDVAGTPAFMPRQQLIDYRNAKPEVDVWAAAASLYYMLTLQYARDFPKGKDRWQVVLQTDAVPIRERDSTIPRELAEVIDAALIEKSAIRFKTASALRYALAKALKNRP
jgi:serine/threonine protein kinase